MLEMETGSPEVRGENCKRRATWRAHHQRRERDSASASSAARICEGLVGPKACVTLTKSKTLSETPEPFCPPVRIQGHKAQ
jgi:hypothetical protein